MEKLQNGLCNDVIRGRQSTMYRAQRLAEFALYDGDPTLIDGELDLYLAITPEQIRSSVERYLDIENRVVLDIVPGAPADAEAEVIAESVAPASPQPPGEPSQPVAPPAQVPPVAPIQPAAPAEQTERTSGPLHT
jgi:hypothetical protein